NMAEEFNTDDMLGMYLFENSQLLENLQDMVLEQKDAEYFDEDSINEIFRTMHTIKGSSAIMMFDDITKVAHKLEDVFYYLRESHPQNVPHQELVAHVLDVADFISGEMEKIQDGGEADGSSAALIKELDDFLDTIKGEKKGKKDKTPEREEEKEAQQFYIAPAATAVSTSNFFRIYIEYYPEMELVNVHAFKIVHELKEVAEDLIYSPEDIITNEDSAKTIIEDGFKILMQTKKSEADLRTIIKPGYDIKKVDIYACTQKDFEQGFGEGDDTQIDLTSSVEEIEAKAAAAQQPGVPATPKAPAPGDFVVQQKNPGQGKKLAKDKPKKAEKAAYISVDIAKMDMLMDLIGELVISESVVLQNPDLKVPGLKLDNFNKAAAQMSKISTDLQNVIMSMRMVPLTNTFQKMNRIVFDMSRKLGKDIEFEMIGETTEVDKNIIEHISDPLMHIVRNSVDHGIETKEERAAAGKTERGKITLSAKTESGKVWISVEDNGAGLNREQILAKARKNGLLDPAKPDSAYTDKEVNQFILLPGFSTNTQVTEYSGRGVGMDVVVSNLQQIGGALDIESVEGQGTTMNLKIPLTLAIVDGIVMHVGTLNFVIETGVVKEFVRVEESQMIHEPSGDESVMIRGDCYPVRRLGDWYHLSDFKTDVSEGMMVLIEEEGNQMCLFVDSIIGKQEIVVKPIPSYIKKVRGLSGCTQLGDGSIALILDPGGICE
ncbi:MAG: chemotaxis protein CheA, partial [Clostridiales bacterium]|nr:chemotaxis protein CheA [Clostridiales bacterium]